MAVHGKPDRSSASARARRGRAATPLPAAVVHRPGRRHVDGDQTPVHAAPHAADGAAPAAARQSPGHRPPVPRDSVGALLFVFLAATLVMVAAVILVGIVERSWVLVPVMLVDFATTLGVVAYITGLLADDGESPA
jgi:hypothetical protein